MGRTVDGVVVSTHVRRELRELLPADLEALMAAMVTMYTTPTPTITKSMAVHVARATAALARDFAVVGVTEAMAGFVVLLALVAVLDLEAAEAFDEWTPAAALIGLHLLCFAVLVAALPLWSKDRGAAARDNQHASFLCKGLPCFSEGTQDVRADLNNA